MVVRQHSGFLRILDDHWNIESSLLRALCGSSAETRAGTAVLQELPSQDRRVTPSAALARLEALEASSAMLLTPTGVQASVRFIVKHLQNLVLGVTLSESLDSCSSLVKKALSQLAFS